MPLSLSCIYEKAEQAGGRRHFGGQSLLFLSLSHIYLCLVLPKKKKERVKNGGGRGRLEVAGSGGICLMLLLLCISLLSPHSGSWEENEAGWRHL